MKLVFTLIAILSTQLAFAGPEDHMNQLVCYNNTSANIPANVPSTLCLETITVNLDTQKIEVYNYFDQKQLSNLTLNYLARHNEDRFIFRASKVLSSVWQSGCGEGEQVEVNISGNVDNEGMTSASNLDVTVTQNLTNDTCHSRPQTEVFKYILQ